MNSKKIATSTDNVHVFGVPKISSCSKEEYNMIFNKDYDISNFYNNKASLDNPDKIINRVLEHLQKYNYKETYSKLTKCISLTLFMASNPTACLALSSSSGGNLFREMIEQLGADLLDGVSMGAIKGVLIVTALRLFVEYTKGGSKYRFFDIAKQCLIVLLIIIILPTLPGIVTLVVDKNLTY